MKMIDRRSFIGASAAGVFASAMPGPAFAAGVMGSGDAALAALLQRHSEAYLVRSPEEATGNDFDTGAHAGLRHLLDDRSMAARATDRTAITLALAQLGTIDRASLSPRAALDYDVAGFVYRTLDDLLGRYGYVDGNLRPSPYVVSQMNGAYYWLPDFIGSRHPIEDKADAEAWLARLAALGPALDQETDRIRYDAGLGVIPPNFVISKTIAQIKALRDGAPLQSALIAPALTRIATKQLGDYAPRAEAVFRSRIAPALGRQIAALDALLPKAVDIAGVWRLPDGEAYYAAACRSNTTADISPADLHETGLAQCKALIAEIDISLVKQGMSKDSVGARIAALNADARFRVSDDDTGRAKLLAIADGALRNVIGRLPRAFGNVSVDPIVVRRIPPAIESGAPGAFYSEGAKGEAGVFSLNLKTPAEHSTWRLPTLAHHEGVPGHHFQYSVLAHSPAMPQFRKMVRFSAYTEGWALYAQQVADELGIYENDPFGRIGYLQSELFRAARIVVDTGIHYKRWTKDQAVAWMVDNAGEQPLATEREVTRYCVYPGQACSFKVGANRIVAARESARKTMGSRFDLRGFHDLVLQSGPVPLAVLEKSVAAWAAAPGTAA
jgi:uncharacterized protein (DUF885 family)